MSIDKKRETMAWIFTGLFTISFLSGMAIRKIRDYSLILFCIALVFGLLAFYEAKIFETLKKDVVE